MQRNCFEPDINTNKTIEPSLFIFASNMKDFARISIKLVKLIGVNNFY